LQGRVSLSPSICPMPKRKKIKAASALPVKRCKLAEKSPFKAPVRVSKAKMSKVKVLASPEKSENDKKEYRVIQLENGLKCLLIADLSYPLEKLDEEEAEEEDEEGSDEEGEEEEESEDGDSDGESEDEEGGRPGGGSRATGLKMAAAGLSVHMGSFSDPEDIPGLAHFLEHMVFMGSKKYPDENGFDSFIAKHGGFDNASTDTETTVFYFESPRRYFQEGLDRFAQFFIAPLMKQDAMEREREAVDSEYQMALPSDSNRLCQIMGGLAKPGHPMAKFMWGNKGSLSPDGLTDEQMHKRLHEFRLRHYTAQCMYLTVQSQQSLDTLQEWVVASYSGVANNNQAREEFSAMPEPFATPAWPKLYSLIPVKNDYKVDLAWALPPLLQHFKSKPLNYLSHLIGHEGRGSLMSALRRRVWALSLTAGNAGDGFEFNSTYSLFPITITLTREGYQHVGEVVQMVHQYLDMVRAEEPSERTFKEIQRIEQLGFTFAEERQPSDNVERLCEAMPFYPPELYLKGEDLLFDFDPQAIRQCLEKMDRESVNIFLRSKELASTSLDQTEPWFGTKFSCEEIPNQWREEWVEVGAEFHMPHENSFIATDLSLRPPDSEAGEGKLPSLLLKNEGGELYYRKDATFMQPRAYIYYLLRSPLQLQSPENAALLDLMVMCLLQNLVEDIYPADLAQLSYSIYAAETGLCIKVSGLSHKLPALLELIITRLCSFTTDTTEQMFKAVLEQQKKNYRNHSIKAKQLVRDVRLSVLQDVFYAPHVRHSVVRSATLPKLNQFVTSFLGDLYLQSLMQGNLTRQEAIAVNERLLKAIKPKHLGPNAVTEVRCNKLPKDRLTLRVEGLDTRDANTLVTNYYQGGTGTIALHATMETIVMMMEEPIFDTLRTQEQLGYQVSIQLRNTHGVLGVSVTVNTQATKFTPEHVDERIEVFFENFVAKELTEERVAEAVAALVKQKLRADVTLEEEVGRNWGEVTSNEFLFNRSEKEVEALGKVTLDEVKAVLEPLLKERKISVQIVGSSSPDAAQETEDPDAEVEELVLNYQAGEKFISEPGAWKQSLETHPLHYITQ